MEQIEELVEIFKALSDPTRLRLVKLLGNHQGALCVNALAHQLGITQSAVSQHLRVLRQARLVKGERQGCHVHYSLDPDRLAQYRVQVREIPSRRFLRLLRYHRRHRWPNSDS
jgi:DNA-binding transcriptional ArsR family regulator